MKKPKKAPTPPAALLIALSKLAKPDPLPAGEYPARGNALFAVDAIVSVGEPNSAKATVRVDAARLIAAFLHLAPLKLPPPEKLHELIQLAFALASTVEPTDERYRSWVAQIEDSLDRCREEAAALLPRVERAGIVRAPGTCELVAWEPKD